MAKNRLLVVRPNGDYEVIHLDQIARFRYTPPRKLFSAKGEEKTTPSYIELDFGSGYSDAALYQGADAEMLASRLDFDFEAIRANQSGVGLDPEGPIGQAPGGKSGS